MQFVKFVASLNLGRKFVPFVKFVSSGIKIRAIREIRGLFEFEDKKFVQFVKFVASLNLGIKIRAIREIRGLFEFGDKNSCNS